VSCAEKLKSILASAGQPSLSKKDTVSLKGIWRNNAADEKIGWTEA